MSTVIHQTKTGAARARLLRNASLGLMEVEVRKRLGREAAISLHSREIVSSSGRKAAASERGQTDFVEQATLIAADQVDRAWSQISALVERIGDVPTFVSLETIPTAVLDSALWPGLDGPHDHATHETGTYRAATRHLVAHGLVGIEVTRKPVSVGYSGFMVAGSSTRPIDWSEVLVAGVVVDALYNVTAAASGCGCDGTSWDYVLALLGPWPTGMEGTTEQVLRQLGRFDEVHDFYLARWHRAADILVEAMRTGQMEARADELEEQGRIEFARL